VVAWPAEFGDTGVMTFIINHKGKVFEKNLGPDTAELVKKIEIFNPQDGWAEVIDVETVKKAE